MSVDPFSNPEKDIILINMNIQLYNVIDIQMYIYYIYINIMSVDPFSDPEEKS